MGETAHILRVVVVSPRDVQAERDCLPAVIDEINRNIARDQGLRLEFVGWEKDTYPGMHPAGPQGLIDLILRVEDCDVLIGILWKRFGTLTLEAQSGTEHEFRRAYAAWQQHQRPHIMMYFNQKRHKPRNPDEEEQWRQVCAFKQHLPKEALAWDYNGKPQFEHLVRRHLTQFLRYQPVLSPALQHAYLTWVM